MTLAIIVLLAQLLTSFTAPVAAIGWRRGTNSASRLAIEDAVPNDNRAAAGRRVNGVPTIELDAREVLWRPDGPTGGVLPVYAFAEAGRPAQIPGPMVRVPAGTEIHVSVRNTLRTPLRFRGLQDHASGQLDTIVVAPDSTVSFRFRADVVGTYYYFARASDQVLRPTLMSVRRDAALSGAFIVDSAGSTARRDERIFLINFFLDTVSALGHRSEAGQQALHREFIRDRWFTVTVNGLSWPHTERLTYTVGDTVHWRVINAGAVVHPMHLHGFYFDVDSRGVVASDTIYTPAQRRKAVTEPLPGGTTMTMTWVPTRSGNWLFHCHIVTHIDPALRLGENNDPASGNHANHAEQGMAGLVMGIYVKPAKGGGVVLAGDPRPRKKLRLFVTERANVYGSQPGYSYILQEGRSPPAADSMRVPSSTIFLRQHEPTEITVINRAKMMATVHWHGIELESFYDGVGDWSGWGTRLAPAIPPGDSFVVRMTPGRAGTFIYHAHVNETVQLASGLFGTLIVLPEKGERDTTERVFLFGVGGPHDEALPTINGSSAPAPIELRAGVPHRFRFINITPLEIRAIQLLADTVRQEWRAVAKDGADLPPQQARMRAATVLMEPGETFDFEVLRQRPESLTLQVEAPQTMAVRSANLASGTPRRGIPRLVTKIPVIVR